MSMDNTQFFTLSMGKRININIIFYIEYGKEDKYEHICHVLILISILIFVLIVVSILNYYNTYF